MIDWGIAKQFPVSQNLMVWPGIAGQTDWQIREDDKW